MYISITYYFLLKKKKKKKKKVQHLIHQILYLIQHFEEQLLIKEQLQQPYTNDNSIQNHTTQTALCQSPTPRAVFRL